MNDPYDRNRLSRATITLPKGLLSEIDRIAGRRGRSRYIAEAIARRLRLDAQSAALASTEAALAGSPGWMDPQAATEWVATLRKPRG
jgi:predicted transcriptional regulator